MKMDVALLLVAAAAGLCVVSSQGAGRQYHLIQNQVTWTEAQSYCRENYTDLVTINSMEDMEVLNNMTASSGASEAWIGLYDDVDSWRWSLTNVTFYKPGEVDFRAWDNGQPNNRKSEEYCVTINDEGRWHDFSCGVLLPAICINETGFVLASTNMTWTDAQSYCRDHHTDLASVRNMEENNEVMNLVPSGQIAWIGLFRESWKWSDGSSLSFTYWRQGEPNNYQGTQENCVVAYFDNSGRWTDWSCDRKTAFICYSDTRTTPEPTLAHESTTPEPTPAHESTTPKPTPKPTPAHESTTPKPTPKPTPARESSTPEPTPARESSTQEPTPARESSTPELTPARESTTPEPTPARESTTPEPTQEPTPARESSTPEPTPARESSTQEPTPVRESSTPEPTPARESSTLEPTPARESTTPEPTPARESTTPEPTPARESSTPEPTPAHESSTPEPTPVPTTEEQAPRVSRKVVRVKLKRSSSVDLDDPAVAQKILEQLKQRLKEQGLPGDVKLSWRKKPDGKIFHQEKKETKKKKSSRRKRDEL